MVFDWGGGIWNGTRHSTGPVIATVAETNTAIRFWGPVLLAHTDHHAVYHSAATLNGDLDAPMGPESATVTAEAGGLVQEMAASLMIGVMTKPVGDEEDTVMLVIVDKRCSIDWQEPEGAARAVKVSLHSNVTSVTVMNDNGRSTEQQTSTVQLQLKAAGAAVIVLRGEGVVAMARGLRKWRFDPSKATLAHAFNTQMQYYTHYFPKKEQPRTSMMLALNTVDSFLSEYEDNEPVDDNTAIHLQSLHFTAAVFATDAEDDEDDEETAVALNALMRRGIYGILVSPDPIASVDKFKCSPSLAGVVLNGGVAVDANDSVALAKVGSTCAQLRWKAGHILPLVIAGESSAIPATMASEAIAAAGCPTAPFRGHESIHAPVLPRTKLEAETMQSNIASISVDQTNAATTMVEVRGPAASSGPYALKPGQVRFAVWVSLMWNTKGLLYSMIPYDILPVVGELNRRVTAIAARLEKSVLPSRIFTAANGTDVCPRSSCGDSQRPGQDDEGNSDKTVTVQSMDEHLIVYEIESCGSLDDEPELDCPTPPMLLVLDTRVDVKMDRPKEASVTLQKNAWGWMPIEGDCAAGFTNCAKMVVGNELSLRLRPGDAQLIALTIAR